MSALEQQIANDLKMALEQDKLVLPTLPEVALEVRTVAENKDAGVADLAEVISRDAALTTRVIRVCNSPLLRGAREITDISMAVNRLGMSYSATLASGLAMQQMFQATTDMIDRHLREVWQNSSEVAAIATVLAKQFTRLPPAQATLAGLIHQIGVLPILTYIEENNIQINSVMLDNVIDHLHPMLGDLILQKWDFPAEIARVPSEHVRFDRQVPAPDMADVVMVAKLQSLAGTDHKYTRMDWAGISAFQRLGIDPNFAEEEDLSAQMEAMTALLGSG